MKFFSRLCPAVFALGLLTSSALPAQVPAERSADADAILQRLRMSQTLSNLTLQGHLRVSSKKTPFILKLAGPQSTYTFSDTGESLRLSLGETDSKIEEIAADGSVKAVSSRQFADKVGGTPMTYEDISLRFLYWPHASVEGDENVNSFDCWKIWVATPKGSGSQYAGAYIWAAKKGGALMRVDCYAPGSILAKRFRVISGQEIKREWVLKSMRIESYDPPGSAKPSISYLEIDGAAAE